MKNTDFSCQSTLDIKYIDNLYNDAFVCIDVRQIEASSLACSWMEGWVYDTDTNSFYFHNNFGKYGSIILLGQWMPLNNMQI